MNQDFEGDFLQKYLGKFYGLSLHKVNYDYRTEVKKLIN